MPKFSRRAIIRGGIALGMSAPALRSAKAAPSPDRTVRAAMHADLRSFDPIWTTATITSYHGAMIYDTLFGMDEAGRPQPQMVGQVDITEDRKTYTMRLRDGLKFSDGTDVTSSDCVASIRRWAARDGSGKHMFARVTDTPTIDDKTFQFKLSEPYPLLIAGLSKVSSSQCFMMRRKEAETDPNAQIKDYIGSGPFTINRDESRAGNRYVYDRNPLYVARPEPASSMAGGKIVKIDRAVFENIGDDQTALNSLQTGQIDFFENPPQDMVDDLRQDPQLEVGILNTTGRIGIARLNFLQPPFDNVYARRAMLYLIDQAAIMEALNGKTKSWKKCQAFFSCDNPMQNNENTDWFQAAPDIAKAKELFAKAGYDGRPVVILHATDNPALSVPALLVGQWLRQAGVNATLASSDWGGVMTRRVSKKPIDEGGWNIFFTASFGSEVVDPIAFSAHAASGENGWFGWPKNELHEKLRDEWAAAQTLEEQQRIGREIQRNAWDFVPHVYYGQFYRSAVWRKVLSGIIKSPQIIPFWGMEKSRA